jgi:hypothetical protein
MNHLKVKNSIGKMQSGYKFHVLYQQNHVEFGVMVAMVLASTI